MFKRNFPLILLLLVFVALFDVMFSVQRYELVAPVVVEPVPEQNVKSFTGRVVMPKLDDIYVLENSAGRDLVQLERFLQGRAAGLHYLASEHFKALKKQRRAAMADVVVGIRVTLDSTGAFNLDEFVFANTGDEEFKQKLADHIKYFWRYPKSTAGKLEFWIPIRWLAKY